jgi:hypothetical protein
LEALRSFENKKLFEALKVGKQTALSKKKKNENF